MTDRGGAAHRAPARCYPPLTRSIAGLVLLAGLWVSAPRSAHADEPDVVSGWTADPTTCSAAEAAGLASASACVAVGGDWRTRTQTCECPASAIAPVATADTTIYGAANAAVELLRGLATALDVRTLYAVTLDGRARVSARYRLQRHRPDPRPGTAAVAMVVIVDAKTWRTAKVGKPLVTPRTAARFIPLRASDQPTLDDHAIAAVRAALLAVTGATAVTITTDAGRLQFAAPVAPPRP